MKWIILAIVIVIVLAVGIVVFVKLSGSKDNSQKEPVEATSGDFEYVCFDVSGGELNVLHNKKLLFDGTLTIQDRESNGLPTYETVYSISEDYVKAIADIINTNGLRKWKDLKKSDMFVLDAPSSSFSIKFAKGEYITVGDMDIPPENGWTYIRQIEDIIDQAIADENTRTIKSKRKISDR